MIFGDVIEHLLCIAPGYTSVYYYIYFSLSSVVCARQFNVIFIFFINIHYFVTCLGYMVPGGCVFTHDSANVFVRTLLY